MSESAASPSETTETRGSESSMAESSVPQDPLGSRHPIPWRWIINTHQEVSSQSGSGVRYYRSQSLVSPDGQYAAYSRIKLRVQPELYRSHVSSVLFVENLQNGHLRAITPTSPFADHPFAVAASEVPQGAMSILVPVSWSSGGDRVLAREFEGIFNSSVASDYAVIWDRQQDRTATIAPNNIEYTNAILLGWSQNHNNSVLFRAGIMGEPQWSLWAVNFDGTTVAANQDEAVLFGRTADKVWSGPQQAYWQ
ncbi:hypothetical protein [Geitlerinema sp. PCC 9228]|uniref:hypothetical protein n=1 Tax=Geitlerinema sp. PCC 9228 TaxID=111611 RepID=UPI001FCD7C2F|nr:hypothetical protein [Geitlerinema sp. PCC 9228]